MSAFGGKADMAICACLLLRSLLGAKRTWPVALHMSAFDPKRTLTLSRYRAGGFHREGCRDHPLYVPTAARPNSSSDSRLACSKEDIPWGCVTIGAPPPDCTQRFCEV